MANTEEIARRAAAWADARPARVGGRNPWILAVRVVQGSIRDRVTGLAAEMAFFALLSLVPAVVALGASLGQLERIFGQEAIAQGRDAVVSSLATVFSPQVTADVLDPLVEGLLEEQRGGVALSSLAIALFLASRVFTATIRALDTAYNVEERRNLLQQRLIAMAFAVGAVVFVPVVLMLAIVGPLLGTGRDLADQFGLGEAFAAAWAFGRWPVVLLLAVVGFSVVYRFGPNAGIRWRASLPGAVLGVVLWVLVSLGFRLYLATLGDPTGRFAAGEEAAALLAVVGAVVVAVLWIYLSSLALLVGGELNAELAATRPVRTTRRARHSGRTGARGRALDGPRRGKDNPASEHAER
jgi:membrane protein